MKTNSINQVAIFNSTAKQVYEALIDDRKLSFITGSIANIDKNVNGKFNVFDGYCHGYNIELIPNKKIVQAWHFAEDGWPEDHFSICTFILEESENKTILTFTQTEVPEHKVDALSNGWEDYYWKPLYEFLNQLN